MTMSPKTSIVYRFGISSIRELVYLILTAKNDADDIKGWSAE